MTKEDILTISIMDYLRMQYSNVPVTHVANERQGSVINGAKLKRMGMSSGFPDLAILTPRGDYHGLFIELKVIEAKIGNKGTLIAPYRGKLSDNQKKWLDKLTDQGYKAVACWGFDSAKEIIDEYLRG